MSEPHLVNVCVLPHLCREGLVVAGEDHRPPAVEAVGDDGVGPVAVGWVEVDVGFDEKHELPALPEDLGELRETQVRRRQVEGCTCGSRPSAGTASGSATNSPTVDSAS